MYSYKKSIKSNYSDELINIYIIRPIAGIFVWALYDTSVTPNQVTITSIIAGLFAALFYLEGTPNAFIVAGLLITLKDILDSADGQLARAKQQYSRVGRFLDSIGDFIVNFLVFSAIGWTLCKTNSSWYIMLLSFLAFVGITFRVSYHVFYQVKFLHLHNEYLNNRTSEEILNSDLKKGGAELILQRIFQLIYGWQDKSIALIDRWNHRNNSFIQEEKTEIYKRWYSDYIALRISSFLGLGSELFLLMICSVINELELYLYLNLFLMNGIMGTSIIYRRYLLAKGI